MFQLYVNDDTGTVSKEMQQLVVNLLTFAMKAEDVLAETEVSVTFLTDDEIQEVNKAYRNIDLPTDVISFALEESLDGEMENHVEGMPILLGDILISVQTARRQAKELNHSLEREIGFLTVHGLLHLLGYDHLNEEDEKEMFSRQEEILKAFGLER